MLKEVILMSVTGLVFLIPGLAVYFILLDKDNKKQTALHAVSAVIFCYYIIGVFTMTGISSFKRFAPRFCFVPFRDMYYGPVDTVLNIILFLPLGIFLPMLYRKFNTCKKVTLTGFLMSLAIETTQMFGMGATDINDLITNTVGAALGFAIYRGLSKAISDNTKDKAKAVYVNDNREVLFFVLYAYLVMVTVQPAVISALFNLG